MRSNILGTLPWSLLLLIGKANIARLAIAQMEESEEVLPGVLELREVYSRASHTPFHLYRKLTRSVDNVEDHRMSLHS